MFGVFTIKTILKLKKIFQLGYCPSRMAQSYDFVNPYTKTEFFTQINCFAHAVFNLSNQQIYENCLTNNDTDSFRNLIEDYWETEDSIFKRLSAFITKTGLKIEKCNDEDELKENQWRVALYFCDGWTFKDFHFLLNESDGRWSSKYGTTNLLEFFDERPEKYIAQEYNDRYDYYGTYKITNPYAGKGKMPLTDKEKAVINKHKKSCEAKLSKIKLPARNELVESKIL